MTGRTDGTRLGSRRSILRALARLLGLGGGKLSFLGFPSFQVATGPGGCCYGTWACVVYFLVLFGLLSCPVFLFLGCSGALEVHFSWFFLARPPIFGTSFLQGPTRKTVEVIF